MRSTFGISVITSSFSFGFSRLEVATADNLFFYNMEFLFLRSDALPATNPLFRGKTGPPVLHSVLTAGTYITTMLLTFSKFIRV